MDGFDEAKDVVDALAEWMSARGTGGEEAARLNLAAALVEMVQMVTALEPD